MEGGGPELELQGVIDDVEVDRMTVVCLRASPEPVARRIAEREPDAWPGKTALISHARELALSIPAIAGLDAVLDTDGRPAAEVVAEVRELLRDHGVVATPRSA